MFLRLNKLGERGRGGGAAEGGPAGKVVEREKFWVKAARLVKWGRGRENLPAEGLPGEVIEERWGENLDAEGGSGGEKQWGLLCDDQ